MSGPSLKTRERRRRQVARFIAEHGFEWSWGSSPLGGVWSAGHSGATFSSAQTTRPPHGVFEAMALGLVAGALPRLGRGFDVRVVRAAALELVALEDVQAVFEDWTRARGLGPENRGPGAFKLEVSCAGCYQNDRLNAGSILEEEPCPWCHAPGGWPGKLAREWPGDSRAPMGRALARLGRRVLEVLEGQPDECESCGGSGESESSIVEALTAAVGVSGTITLTGSGDDVIVSCPDCHGTGANLRGRLPPVEMTARERFEAGAARADRRARLVAQMRESMDLAALELGGPSSEVVEAVRGTHAVYSTAAYAVPGVVSVEVFVRDIGVVEAFVRGGRDADVAEALGRARLIYHELVGDIEVDGVRFSRR